MSKFYLIKEEEEEEEAVTCSFTCAQVSVLSSALVQPQQFYISAPTGSSAVKTLTTWASTATYDQERDFDSDGTTEAHTTAPGVSLWMTSTVDR